MNRNVSFGVSVALLLLASSSAKAETIRFIAKPMGDGVDHAFDWQNYNTNTPYVGQGGVIRIPRGLGSAVWVFKHLIDVTPVTITSGQLTVTRLGTVNGVQSQVFMPAVTGVAARAGGIGYGVTPPRRLAIGSQHTFTLTYPLNDKNSFVAEVVCPANEAQNSPAKLASATITDNTLTKDQGTILSLKADVRMACGGQPLAVRMPPCFKIRNPVTTKYTAGFDLTWEEKDSPELGFAVQADTTCSSDNSNKALDLTVTLSGVALSPKLTLTWIPTLDIPPRPLTIDPNSNPSFHPVLP